MDCCGYHFGMILSCYLWSINDVSWAERFMIDIFIRILGRNKAVRVGMMLRFLWFMSGDL